MEISQEFSDFLWEWSAEIANAELREIWAEATQHDKFFEVDQEVNLE
jgi:hypothetical protein